MRVTRAPVLPSYSRSRIGMAHAAAGVGSDSTVTVADDTPELIAAIAKATFRNLGHAGAALRLAAQRLIRTRANSSDPGTPPHTRQGALRNSILYAVENDHTVVIGPAAHLISDVARVHEHGGRQRPRSAQGRTAREQLASGANWRLRVGGHGPIGDGMGGTVYIRFVSQAQVDRSIDYIESAPDDAFGTTRKARRQAEKRRIRAAVAEQGGVATYPKRPFMGPALAQNASRLPSLWANSIH